MPTIIAQKISEWTDSGSVSENSADALNQWLTEPEYVEFNDEIKTLIERNEVDELEDAFRTHIEFGTGGIRGKMGPGPNRINLRTIGEAAQGLANYVKQANSSKGSVVIAYDTRHNSERFAREVASIVAGNGITARIFNGHRSTPELSYALRKTGASAGVVISASHNPPSDNGFKAYWCDGGQVVSPHDKAIMAEVTRVKEINRIGFDQGVAERKILFLGKEIDAEYHKRLGELALVDDRNISIVYTPLHGVGATSVVPALKSLGYDNLHLLAEQAIPDGSFPTVLGGVANPEDPATMTLAIEKAREMGADIVLASDPDADRLGCALPLEGIGWDAKPHELALNGNQIGAILCHHILQSLTQTGKMPEKGLVAKTIVTTDLTGIIGRAFGAEVVDNLLVGFKYIGAVIESLPADTKFLFGTEESHGYLSGSFVRDKDAASAAILLVECAASLKNRGLTIRQYLDYIYETHGYFREIQKSTYREGAQGNREIAQIMAGLRENPPSEIGEHQVHEAIDYQVGITLKLKTGETGEVVADRGNVMAFTFTDTGNTRVTARPSGTEPKIKYYVSATSADNPQLASPDLASTKEAVDRLSEEIAAGVLDAAEAALQKQQT
ncbi:MAG: hypothetical protein CME25_08355 [Gemmatimonadetes bacterium]|nr:hypothetical protein [Gemmatimonadota bacterium]